VTAPPSTFDATMEAKYSQLQVPGVVVIDVRELEE
jgi:hypothetical protein